jgi:hypothetical protein
MSVKCLPIIENNCELEMLKSTSYYVKRGFRPTLLKPRSSNTKLGTAKIREEHKVPEKIGTTHRNIGVITREVTMIDTYGRKIKLNKKDSKSLELCIKWFLNLYPKKDDWDSRIEEIEFEIIKKSSKYLGTQLRFKRGNTSGTTKDAYSLRLHEIKPVKQKWQKEEDFTEKELYEMCDGLTESQCKLDYSLEMIEKKKPKCIT